MPATRLGNKYSKKAPPIDLLKGVILERKSALHLRYDEIAADINVTPDYLRKLMTTKHTKDWSVDILNPLCRRLGISILTTLSLIDDDGIRLE